ncbi:MAG: VWA domain-containing protein [Thermoanaerobaculia bacterium]|nr:VWA domain-containing protein [Thermoanaerobaculia bacterium]
MNQQLLRNFVHFQVALRRLGVDTTGGQLRNLVEGLEHVGLEYRAEVKAAAKAALISRREDLTTFEQLFDLFFHPDAVRPRHDIQMGTTLRRIAQRRESRVMAPQGAATGQEPGPCLEQDHHALRLGHTDTERLRRKDFARLTDDERREIARLLRDTPWDLPARRTRRFVPASSGERIDLRRTLRDSSRSGTEPIRLHRRRRKRTPRPLVVLVDISGSMESYARIFLQFIYSLRSATGRLEAFVFATRLTRLTRQLRQRDVDDALAESTARIVDWGGGTRIGASFHRFNHTWGRRVLGRRAVVAVMSDAWDRGDQELLERETRRLAGSCHRLFWLNPLLGSEAYQPIASGIRTVLPFVDQLLPVHDLESLEQLAAVFRAL